MKAKPVAIALASCLLTLAAVLLVLNLGTGEKKIERQLDATVRHTRTRSSAARWVHCSARRSSKATRPRCCSTATRSFPPCWRRSAGPDDTITFETYIYWSETIGREFADALIERARAGVKVHVLLDWVGSAKMEERYLAGDAGAPASRSSATTSPIGPTCSG